MSDEMRARRIFTNAVVVVIIVCYSRAQQLVRMCYFRTETIYKTDIARFGIEHVNFSLCTHYIYAYGHIDASSKIIRAQNSSVEEGARGQYNRLNNAKLSFPLMKTLLSIGGPSMQAHQAFVAMNDDDMFVFATSAVIFLRRNGFDGLDIDWLVPPNYRDRERLPRILQVLRQQFDAEGGSPRLLLTLAAPGQQADIDRGFDVATLYMYVDYALVKSYNLYLALMDVAHFSSPLFPPPMFHTFPLKTLNMNYSIHYWNAMGMPFKKIVVGITGVGRYLELHSALDTTPVSSVTRTFLTGDYYGIPRSLAYPEVCFKMERSQLFFDTVQKCPYLVNQRLWIGFENAISIKEKLDWMRGLGVAGIMFAGLEEDDFTGTFCEDGTYPLLNYIKSEIGESTATTWQPTTTTTTTVLPPENTDLALNDTMILTILCLFIYGFVIGLAFLILSQRNT